MIKRVDSYWGKFQDRYFNHRDRMKLDFEYIQGVMDTPNSIVENVRQGFQMVAFVTKDGYFYTCFDDFRSGKQVHKKPFSTYFRGEYLMARPVLRPMKGWPK